MSSSPRKTNCTPRKRLGTCSVTPVQYSTPKPRKKLQICAPETPECFANVLLETPKAVKHKSGKDKCDEISNLRVGVRIRPMNASELATVGVEDVIQVKNQDLVVCTPKNAFGVNASHIFQYDHIFWSVDETSPLYSTQEDVFLTIGVPLLNSAFRGFNACLFAYGQTGSGKSYSMMGRNVCEASDIDSEDYSGITPRFCRELFKRAAEMEKDCAVSIEVSYFEIYNEKIHDLLDDGQVNRVPLKVREHPVLGPYIVDLTTRAVKTYGELRNFLIAGNKNRATAATSMNEASSRSHAIFSIELGQSKGLDDTDNSRRSRVSLVDLAGSERLGSSYNSEEKTKQGVYINRSLLTLGKVISALSDQRKNLFVPYRDSVLTWLLRESLGGNSLTSMLATISPASTHLDETLATLRYACQARAIVNRARINESPHDRLISELRSEVERLRALRQDYERRRSFSQSVSSDDGAGAQLEEVRTQLRDSEDRLFRAQQMWEQRFMETKEMQMKELAEAEKYRAELESRVRVLKTARDDVSLSPYKTNFLEELEGVLTDESEESDRLWNDIRNWCSAGGLICTFESDTLKIVDPRKGKQTMLPLSNVTLKGFENIGDFVNSLRWKEGISNQDKKLTRAEVASSMNEIYQLLANLQPTDNENNLSLLFAKVNRSLQSFETALLNSLKNTKTVTFRVDS